MTRSSCLEPVQGDLRPEKLLWPWTFKSSVHLPIGLCSYPFTRAPYRTPSPCSSRTHNFPILHTPPALIILQGPKMIHRPHPMTQYSRRSNCLRHISLCQRRNLL